MTRADNPTRTKDERIATLTRMLGDCIRTQDSDDLVRVCHLAQIHKMPYNGPVADTRTMREYLERLGVDVHGVPEDEARRKAR